MNDVDRATYIEDPAGEFRVYGAFCEWDSVMEALVPDADTEEEVLDILG